MFVSWKVKLIQKNLIINRFLGRVTSNNKNITKKIEKLKILKYPHPQVGNFFQFLSFPFLSFSFLFFFF